MVNSKEVFGTGPDNIKAAVERVLEIVKVTVGELAKSLPNNSRALAMALWVTVTGAVTSCNSQTPPVNHAPEADITELVEFVQAGELRMPISDLLQMFGVKDPDGDTLSVEVISGPASIEDGYLVVNAGDDVEVKLKVSDGKWWEIILTLKLDVDNPTQISDLSVSVDSPVDGEPYGVYAWGMVDVEFKVDDPDWVLEVVVLVWDELETPVDLDPAGIARLSFDTSGLLVWIYPVKVRVVDGAWNEKVIDLFDLKVYPYGEVVDSSVKVHEELWSPDSSFREARRDEAEEGRWLDHREDGVYLRVKGISKEMVDNGQVRILIASIWGDVVNMSFPAEGFVVDRSGTWVKVTNQSIFPGTWHDHSWITKVVIWGIDVEKDWISYSYPAPDGWWSLPLWDGVLDGVI